MDDWIYYFFTLPSDVLSAFLQTVHFQVKDETSASPGKCVTVDNIKLNFTI